MIVGVTRFCLLLGQENAADEFSTESIKTFGISLQVVSGAFYSVQKVIFSRLKCIETVFDSGRRAILGSLEFWEVLALQLGAGEKHRP